MGVKDILKISFEFSPKLGVRELPKLTANKESNVSGLYIVGDLADAPIIKVALNQGYDVAKKVISDIGKSKSDEMLDVAVLGAGPAGIGAALALEEAGASYLVFEKEKPFNTIQNFPKNKLIFSEPREMENRGNFWFEDAQKEDLVQRWDKALDDNMLRIHQPEEVTGVQRKGDHFEITTVVGAGGLERGGHGTAERDGDTRHAGEPAKVAAEAGAKNTYRARRVILAIGRRGSVRKLGVPGEDLEKVDYTLKDPDDYKGVKLLVIGGGDSAVEAAISCANAGADVTISYRSNAFSRAKALNQEKLQALIDSGKVKAELGTNPAQVREDAVVLKRGDETVEVPNDKVLVFIGTKLPSGFLSRAGIKMAGVMDFGRAVWVISFALITYFFYVLKHKKPYWPFGPGHVLSDVPAALKVDFGFRMVDASFWGTCVYALLILIFGIKAYKKYPSNVQKRRYLSLIGFQWFFLFGIPELVAPAVDYVAKWSWFVGHKIYAISVPWPLSIWSVIDGKGWGGAGYTATAAAVWIAIGAATAFILMPLFVRKQGERFCSYMCGCGGLAETLGDMWRHLAPRGRTAYKSEWFGRVIFLLAIPVTLLILNDVWGFFASNALRDAKTFAQQWYGLMVDFWLASVVGVALYPYLGNRVWCRFFCPLRAYMEMLARRFAKLQIKANDKCIGCGECTRYCQMGIEVQKFAQQRINLHNGNSSCIQCGICVQVCPMEVLTLDKDRKKDDVTSAKLLKPVMGPPVKGVSKPS
ncbi:MAG: NAD(P)-binding domain-containing protein [Myxococcales bacterium]|nr:NAD(P)-binding domain-containing protein [Myxococcales bacterium]